MAVSMIIKWHWCLDAFNGITTLIVALGVTLGVCTCVTMMTRISGSTSLMPKLLCTFRHQFYRDSDIAAAFLPHQGLPLAQGLIVVMTLVTMVGRSQDWWQLMST
jgi:hypothetical protein